MKKSLLSLGLILNSIFMFGQEAKFTLENESIDISGTTHTVTSSTGDDHHVDLFVENISSSSKTWVIIRKKIDVPSSGWSDYLCWGKDGEVGSCYSAGQMNSETWASPDPVTLANGEKGVIAVHINPDNITNGSGTYRYYVGTGIGTYSDSVDVMLTTQSLAVKTIKSNLGLSVYPNPAENTLTIATNSFQEGNLKITDVLGKVILEEKFIADKKIDVSSFKNGVFLAIINVNGISQTKRFVVKH
jgi:hypothetical protein